MKLDFEELVEEQSRFHAALSEIRSFAPFSEEGNVVLSWIAPQDRGSDGGAASYEVLIALCDEGAQTCPCSDGPDIEQELSAALSPGSPERLVINLSTGAEHCLGVVAFDARGLRGDATWLAAPISVDP